MPSEQVLLDYILREIACKKDMMGMKVLVTAGPTMEAVDPVRYITNHSTGKMGYAVAKVCMLRGAQVTLVTGQTTVEKPPFVNVIDVTSAKEMFEAVTDCSLEQDIVVKAAAVADYRPQRVSAEKVKKTGKSMVLELEKDGRYPAVSGEHKRSGQFLCGFSMETENMLENSKKKLMKKNLDMIVANNLKEDGAGFGTDTNVVTMITEDQEVALDLMSKEETAGKIMDMILSQMGKR